MKTADELRAELAALDGQQPVEQAAPAVNPALDERRAQFTGAQRRLAAGLSAISKTNLIDSNSSEA